MDLEHQVDELDRAEKLESARDTRAEKELRRRWRSAARLKLRSLFKIRAAVREGLLLAREPSRE